MPHASYILNSLSPLSNNIVKRVSDLAKLRYYVSFLVSNCAVFLRALPSSSILASLYVCFPTALVPGVLPGFQLYSALLFSSVVQ